MNATEGLITILKKYAKVDLLTEQNKESIILERDLGIDSITLLQIVVDIEDQFAISIADDDLDRDIIKTFSDLLKLIESKLKGIEEFLDNRDYIDTIIDNEDLTRLFDELEKAEEQENN